MIKLPASIQTDLTSLFKDTQFNPSLRQSLNLIYINHNDYNSLFNWLFNTSDFKMNQIKFASYLGGAAYEVETPEYNYSSKSGNLIGYNTMTNNSLLVFKQVL